MTEKGDFFGEFLPAKHMHAGGSSTHIVSTSIGGIKGLICGVRVWRGVRV